MPPRPKISRETPKPVNPPPPPQPRRNQAPPKRRIYCGNFVPSYQNLPEVPPQGPADFSTFVKFATLEEARNLAITSGSSNDGSYLLIPVKFIGRIRNDPRLDLHKKLREIEQNIKKKFKSLHGYNFNYELNNQL